MNVRLQNAIKRRNEYASRLQSMNDMCMDEDREFTEVEAKEYATIEQRLSATVASIERDEKLANIERTSMIPDAANAAKVAQFASLGMQLQSVHRAAVNPSSVDPRLMRAAVSGHNEQNPADGGFLVDKQFSVNLLNRAFETGVLSKMVQRIQIGPGKNGLRFRSLIDNSRATGSRFGAINLYWTDEGGLKNSSQLKFRQTELNLHKLIGMAYATDELLEDAVALESIMDTAFRSEFGFVIDDVIVRGTGAGQPRGILNSNALVTVSKESSQTAATVNLANILKMYARFWSRGKTNPTQSGWFIHNTVMPQLMQLTLGGTATVYGSPVFTPPGGVSGKPYGTLLGIPIFEIEHAAVLGTVGDINLWDMSQYLWIDKGNGIQSDSSIHVRYVYDETAFRWVYRCDGQPLWDKVITQYQGSDTISPFVSLETRS